MKLLNSEMRHKPDDSMWNILRGLKHAKIEIKRGVNCYKVVYVKYASDIRQRPTHLQCCDSR